LFKYIYITASLFLIINNIFELGYLITKINILKNVKGYLLIMRYFKVYKITKKRHNRVNK